jgi:sphinganine-1-phosphate aldolase
LYITPTVAGSRPGALIACAWAALVSIGESGYQQRARVIVEAARRIADAIKSIDGLKLLTLKPTIVVCFTSDVFNIYRLKDAMSKMGWSLNPLQKPAALNVCVTENLDVDEFLHDLRTAVGEVKASIPDQQKTGTELIYNAIRMLPPAAVEFAMHRFTDASLAP